VLVYLGNGHLVILLYCTKKNMATLSLINRNKEKRIEKSLAAIDLRTRVVAVVQVLLHQLQGALVHAEPRLARLLRQRRPVQAEGARQDLRQGED
jgi:hypothetical protein